MSDPCNIEDYSDIQYILAKYVSTQIHACREESEPGLFQILICLKRGIKFYKKQDENDQKAAIGVRYVSCFVGPPPSFLASPATLNLFDNPGDTNGLNIKCHFVILS